MTEEEKITAAIAYFSDHPQADAWHNAGDDLRRGALRIAELDVAIAFGFGDLPEAPEVTYAVLEQALRLLECAGHSAAETILSEQIEGVGSRTIQPRREPFLAPRAERLLAPFLAAARARVTRG